MDDANLEPSPSLATSLLREGLVDRIAWFQAPLVIGDDGMAAIGELGRGALDQISRFKLLSEQRIGPDSFALYSRAD